MPSLAYASMTVGVARRLGDATYDAVVDWVAFTPDHIEQDLRVFAGRTLRSHALLLRSPWTMRRPARP